MKREKPKVNACKGNGKGAGELYRWRVVESKD